MRSGLCSKHIKIPKQIRAEGTRKCGQCTTSHVSGPDDLVVALALALRWRERMTRLLGTLVNAFLLCSCWLVTICNKGAHGFADGGVLWEDKA